MRLALAVALLATGFGMGCARPMNNDQIIREVNKCRDAGMDARYAWDMSGRVQSISCVPKGSPNATH